MERDMAEGVAEMVFADTSIFSGGYPELTERLAKLIDQPEFLADLNERLLGLAEAYAEDKSVMRMPFYRPDKVSEQFQKFALPFQPYQAREGFQWNEQEVFITEDEINAFLAGGGPYSDGRLATYSFFLTHTEKAERAAFLKDRYGVGGSSHALSRADNSHASYDGRGLELARGIYGKPDALVKLNWNQAAERVAKLIDQSLYLKPADYSRMPSYEREQMANRVIGFYHRLPDEVERPFKRELLNEDARKKLPTMLADPEQAVELLEKMDAALLSVPLDSPEYAEKSKTLAELHQYVEGTYTIFPEKKKAVEISVSDVGKRDVLKINKTGTHLRKRTGVVRLRVVAHSETVVHQWRRALFHANRQVHSAILYFAIKLLQPYCIGMMTLHCRCIDGLVILRIFRLITSHKVGTETIAEPLAQVKILQRLDAKLNRLWLRKRPATVGHHKIWRKVAAAGIRAHRAFNLQWRFRRCHSDSRKRYKRGKD